MKEDMVNAKKHGDKMDTASGAGNKDKKMAAGKGKTGTAGMSTPAASRPGKTTR